MLRLFEKTCWWGTGWLVGAVLLLSLAEVAAGESERSGSAQLLVVKRPTPLYQVAGGQLVPGQKLASSTLLAEVPPGVAGGGQTPKDYRYVRTVAPQKQASGWVTAADVERMTGVAAAPAGAASVSPDRVKQSEEMPELIRLRNPQVRQAWEEVQSAIAENRALQPPLPEPYFARAEIWALAGNYDAALRDYLLATRLAREAGQDLTSYSAYFMKIYQTLDNLDQVPKSPALGANQDQANAAAEHFARGYHAFWAGQLGEALQRFDNAVQLQPGQALYWYYRALTFKRLGDRRRAQFDVCLAVYVERKSGSGVRSQVYQALERLQGGHRQWIEGYRLGDPSLRLLEEY